MSKFIAAIEVDHRAESREDQLNRLTRQLREANARNAKAFDEGAAMVIRALRQGAKLEDVARKVRWDVLNQIPAISRTTTHEFDDTTRVPMEFSDSEEHTEPMIVIPLKP